MNTTIAPVAHIHVDLDVDREHKFHYRSRGRDGRQLVLHHADSVTFTCSGDFSVRFEGPSPFAEPLLYSRHSFLTAHVRSDAPTGEYPYTVEVVQENSVISDGGGAVGGRPRIIIESAG